MASKQASCRSKCAYEPWCSKAMPSIVLVDAVTSKMNRQGKRERQRSLAAISSAGTAKISAEQTHTSAVYIASDS